MSALTKESRMQRAGYALESALERTSEGATLVVEGKKDTIALEKFGFSKDSIFEINRGWDLDKVATFLWENYPRLAKDGAPSVILFMDWDRTGGKLQADLKRRLESLDQPVDESLRKELSVSLSSEIKCVEDIVAFKETIEMASGIQFLGN